MRVPLSWLKDYVDIPITAEELAERLTLAGLEVASLQYIGVPQGKAPAGIIVPPSDHLVWARDKIVLGAIREVKAHPNADKLVLALVDYGQPELEQVVTGAPNLYPYKGAGPINPLMFTALALEGAEVFDGHAETPTRMILKEKALRGIPNRSMVCSEKELGLSGEHEGIILLADPGLPPGTPFADVLGDVIFDIELTPNMARAYSILGVAREVAALIGGTMHEPSYEIDATGAPIEGQAAIDIQDSTLNPRFSMVLIRDLEIKPSPEWLQRRLIAVGEHPINNIVDITNYVMLETGQPLHAFDYDVLLTRAGGKTPTIITRTAHKGETLTTLDGEKHTLEDFNELVCDTAGILSLAGIKGGDESKIQPTTHNVLLEAANWNYINVRKTMFTLKMTTEAGGRFSRGVHPAQTVRGLSRAAQLMHEFGSGVIAQGMIDAYPKPAPPIQIKLPMGQVERLLGIPITAEEAASILTRLQFDVRIDGDTLHVAVPDHRTDIGPGEVGISDLCEEIGRIFGYDRLPNTLIDDDTPIQHNNEELSREEETRDVLITLGLRETINYRLTTPDAEAWLNAPHLPSLLPDVPYVTLANPISLDRAVLRHSLLNGLLEVVAANQHHAPMQRIFEIGPVFLPHVGQLLPDEPRRLALAITGARVPSAWQDGKALPPTTDFYDLKGIIESLLSGLHAGSINFRAAQRGAFHPGRCAEVRIADKPIGFLGEIHPAVRTRYDIATPVFAAELDLETLLAHIADDYHVEPIPTQPAMYQDIALIVDARTPAAEVARVIAAAGGKLLRAARLFDVYTGDPIPPGKKSLAYALTYQADDRTLTDKEVAKVHQQIMKAVERELGAKVRT
ncbi:MAG: phenylalanine--tRNA ligase subunit beta [Aggregatilineales bacterium]